MLQIIHHYYYTEPGVPLQPTSLICMYVCMYIPTHYSYGSPRVTASSPTLFNTDTESPTVPAWPEPVFVSTFCAMMRVLSKLAAAAAERPPLVGGGWGGVWARVEMGGEALAGIGDAVVLAMEASVCTSELIMGATCDDPAGC